MKCNKCKSSNVQKYQVIHEQGTSNINLGSNTVGGGVGFGGGLRGGVGLGRTGTSGTSQTLLAKKTQPPKDLRFSTVVLFPLIFIGILFYSSDKTSYSYFFFTYCIVALIFYIYFFVKAGEALEKNYNEWLNTWYCNKCGNSFSSK